jgi:AraC-like DNA-binding protein
MTRPRALALSNARRRSRAPAANTGTGIPNIGWYFSLRAHLGWPARAEPAKDPRLADRLRQLLDARLFETVTLDAAGSVLEASPTHLVRSFTAAYGISPHAYVISRRIDAARRRLLGGHAVARVAVETGFHDQAHLSRHFTRHVGTSPGRFARRRTRAGGR